MDNTETTEFPLNEFQLPQTISFVGYIRRIYIGRFALDMPFEVSRN
jgi:hypothetical protein